MKYFIEVIKNFKTKTSNSRLGRTIIRNRSPPAQTPEIIYTILPVNTILHKAPTPNQFIFINIMYFKWAILKILILLLKTQIPSFTGYHLPTLYLSTRRIHHITKIIGQAKPSHQTFCWNNQTFKNKTCNSSLKR